MEVLQKGTGQTGWATQTTCTGNGNGGGGCGAVLRVDEGDLFETSSSARCETDYFVTFRCCACGVLTDLPTNTVPRDVKDRLPSRSAWCEAHGITR